MTAVRFLCDNCGEAYQVESKHSGKRTKCSKCKSPITVPLSTPGLLSRNTIEISQSERPPAIKPGTATSSIPDVQVTIDHNAPSGLHGFFRAFGITTGFMAGIAAIAVGVPVLACGGCLISMIGIGATVQTPTPPRPSMHSLTDFTDRSTAVAQGSATESNVEIPVTLGEGPGIDPPVSVAETLPVVEIRHPDVGAWAYRFEGLQVTVDDDFIRDVRIVFSEKKNASVDVLFENRTNRPWKPSVRIEIVNRYGFVLSRHNVQWAVQTLEQGKRHSESFETVFPGFRSIVGYSTLAEPKDFDQPVFLVVSY